jgi:hypothetical protein
VNATSDRLSERRVPSCADSPLIPLPADPNIGFALLLSGPGPRTGSS